MKTNKETKKPKIIIDTDPGHDDALALMMLILSEQFEILAITTVAGNSTIENVTRNAQAILNLLNKKIPVYSGSANPLQRELITAVVHGKSGLDGIDVEKTKYKLSGNASQKIVELVTKNPGEVSILALGPLTNIARALEIEPEISNKVDKLVMMGGAINVPGNKNRVAEFNFFVDPEAVNIVFNSKLNKFLIPLDACNQVLLNLKDFQQITNSRLSKTIITMMGNYLKGLKENENARGILVYDALAAYFLLNPSAFELEPMDIVIETKGEHTFGMSLAEKRVYANMTINVLVAMEASARTFKQDFFAILVGKNK